ncbi:hypothetical protein SAMD00023353_1801490 [Rosellinia necatrix]|uniref:Apple domain-containing protein n=1 Tax=Rosellinia necatrix TaxID=77044 RepID=A0A1W2TE38_ROSNE|nr:hypothetical protein SAMD00023353_1801490 [Rosellinia necatrix]
MNSPQSHPDSHKEAISGYYGVHPGLEVAPQPIKAFDEAPLAPVPVPERTICGMRRTSFFLSVALLVVILAAAVGGGVGGSLAVQNAKSTCASKDADTAGLTVVTTTVTAPAAGATSPATSASTSASASATEPLVVPTGIVKLECPGLTDDIAISLGSKSWVFTPACNIDYSGSDFGAVIVYSFHDCLQACAAHNHFSGEDECIAVTFKADQIHYIQSDYGNCWLKRGDPAAGRVTGGDVNFTAGAKLKGSTGS